MGCGASARRHVDDYEAASYKWRETFTRKAARKTFELDGTIPRGCDEALVEFRTYLEDPLTLSKFAEHCKSKNNIDILLCWVEVLEFKSIQAKSSGYQLSKAKNLLLKYIKEGSDLRIKGIPRMDEIETRLSDSILAPDAETVGISTKIFDEFQQQCLMKMHDDLFIPFQSTVAYMSSIREVKLKYNKVSVKDFEYMDVLGQGAFGLVVHCKKKSTGINYALKIQTKVGLLECFNDCPERVVYEKDAVSKCVHPFIISMDYAMQTEQFALMVMDLGTSGTLKDALDSCPRRKMPEERVKFYSAEIILALAHIHRMGLIYRDLKPANVLLNADGHIKLVDLGGIIDVGGKVLGYHGDLEDIDAFFDTSKERHAGGGANREGASWRERFELSISRAFMGNQGHTHHTHGGNSVSYGSHNGRVGAAGAVLSRNNSKSSSAASFKSIAAGIKSPYRMVEPIANLKRAKSIMGTNGYMAPEMLIMLTQKSVDLKGYTSAVDFWSLGVTMFHLLTGGLPFHHSHVASFVNFISARNADDAKLYPPDYAYFFNKLVAENSGVSFEAMECITGFLDVDERKRLGTGAAGMQNIKSNQFFEGLDWSRLEQKLVPAPYLPNAMEINNVFVSSSAEGSNSEDLGESNKPNRGYDTFEDMLMTLGKVDWLESAPTLAEQTYFRNWDFVSPQILKLEVCAERQEREKIISASRAEGTNDRALDSMVPPVSGHMLIQKTNTDTEVPNKLANILSAPDIDPAVTTASFGNVISPSVGSTAASFGISKNQSSASKAVKTLSSIANAP